jgi:5-hydroxyisourate hydrolase
MISTHVLDTERGEPRPGLAVALFRGGELVSEQLTDDDGRIGELAPDGLQAGEYRLVFDVAGEFFRRVELTLTVTEPDRHHHVPLLVSAYSCTTYRGS